MLAVHSLLIVLSPTFVDYILDYYKGNPLIRKNRIKDNFIFLPFIIFFYGFEFVLIRFNSTVDMFNTLIVLSFLFTSIIYYLSINYYVKKFGYTINFAKRVILTISYRLFYSAFLYLTLQFFVFETSNFPVYLLII